MGIVLSLISASIAILINGDETIQPTSSQYVFPSMLVAGSLVCLIDSRRSKPFGIYKPASKGWDAENDITMKRIGIPLWVGGCIFFLWGGILVLVILLKQSGIENQYLEIFETMYRIGSLIFGGGQVVLPMLQSEVSPSWMSTDNFFQGLGLAQSLPGPLFNFSSYLGAVYAGKLDIVFFYTNALHFSTIFQTNLFFLFHRHSWCTRCICWIIWSRCHPYICNGTFLGSSPPHVLV